MDIKDKTVLVTGASRGIGAGIADELVRQGARVFGTATSESGAQAISERLKGLEGAHAGAGLVLDVNDSGSIEQCLATIGEQAGPVAVLVNNAGITKDQLLLRLGEDDWDAVMDTNLRAIYRLSKAVLRGMMKARWGRIINIGSVVGTTGNPGQANYAAAKAGLGGFSRSLAHEIGSRGITVNVVAPGFIETDMTDELNEQQRETLMDQIPVQRLGSPDDIAAAVAFLASDQAGYITGQTLHVNGGMYMAG